MITREQIKEIVEKKLREGYAEPGGTRGRPKGKMPLTQLPKKTSDIEETDKADKDILEAAAQILDRMDHPQAARVIRTISFRIGNK